MSDDEDEEEVPSSSHSQPSSRPIVGFAEDIRAQGPPPLDGGSKAARKGTGFVSPADLPMSDDEDEQEDQEASFIFGGGEARRPDRPDRPDRPASSPGRRSAPQERERSSAQGLRPMLPACKTT
mmetsp:Transcript_107617/g.150068  ORF Transcript_107617/g.150068 Transcript_107617/m.150068 type:complete len:124 (-) Transcript_107617:37-408(-)